MIQDASEAVLATFAEQARQRGLTEQQLLEELVVGNADLERLENLVSQFNIFEATGMVFQEIRHSFFLKFLLDPTESHGLGDFFLKRLLQRVLANVRHASLPISLIDLDVWDLDSAEVRREWNNIDLLVLDATHKMAVIIENKIFTDEHSDQLNRYLQIVQRAFSGWSVISLFVTPTGSTPSHKSYLPASYKLIADLVDDMISSRSSVLGNDVKTLLAHYSAMLRRHIVGESELDELCLRIYHRHQKAMDMIIKRIPDRQAIMSSELTKMIDTTPDVVLAKSSKGRVTFYPTGWDKLRLGNGEGWYSGTDILVFFFDCDPKYVRLSLEIQPGPDTVRQKLYAMAKDNPPLKATKKEQGVSYSRIFTRSVLSEKAMQEVDTATLVTELYMVWDEFRRDELPQIEAILKVEGWL